MTQSPFKLRAPFQPAGGQPQAIKELIAQRPGVSTLLGVTGSGKTFTIANVIASQNKPVLVLAPNKTLAAQLFEEFSLFFPENKVCYFVSYYDYYQPESYLPAQDVYIPKETRINDEIERLRIEATASLVNRSDVIVVASVSCIYSLGNPTEYKDLALSVRVGQKIKRTEFIHDLVAIQYERNETDKKPGTFQVLGNTIEVQLPYQKDKLRIELLGDTIEELSFVSRLENRVLLSLDNTLIFPAKHFVTSPQTKRAAIKSIKQELASYAPTIENSVFRERIERRVAHDLELLDQIGFCPGIENYSIHFDGRKTGEPPFCLLDFFPEDFLLVVDESHIAIPQLRGMYAGDRARKKALIDFGFRLPSAYDNRPLTFDEVERFFKNVIFVSATPGEYELRHSQPVVEQVIRPTGLLDPIIEIYPREGQIAHLIANIRETKKRGYRTLVMVLTKKLAEELAEYLQEHELSVCYLHSDLKTPERTEILQKLRLGIFDCLVGVNLLREGLDLPEVALVSIMDADVESFLRDKRSLIQIAGRAARNVEARVVLYADRVTRSMADAIAETKRRRALQEMFNEKHNITPTSVSREVIKSIIKIEDLAVVKQRARQDKPALTASQAHVQLVDLEARMQEAAERLDFETAIALREEWFALQKKIQKR